MPSTQTAKNGCEFHHYDRESGRCTGDTAAHIIDDHNRRRAACAPMVEFIIHAKGKCSKCRKPLVWCWTVQEMP